MLAEMDVPNKEAEKDRWALQKQRNREATANAESCCEVTPMRTEEELLAFVHGSWKRVGGK